MKESKLFNYSRLSDRKRRSAHDSRVFEVFDEAGAVLLGKTNLSDLGLAPESTNYVCGSTLNPFDAARTAGGSSGGAAAAVASGMTAFDWGTDIGGSIRQPAAFCGIVGVRLSHETWPMRDIFPRVPSVLDWLCGQGPLASTLDQLRCLLDVARPALRTGTPRDFDFEGLTLGQSVSERTGEPANRRTGEPDSNSRSP